MQPVDTITVSQYRDVHCRWIVLLSYVGNKGNEYSNGDYFIFLQMCPSSTCRM